MTLDEFKARIPLVDVIARRVRLTRRGREFHGLCPFHNEKTPSFTVSEDKGFFHCFGCGRHGNAIDFVMASEGLEFGEALERLAELTGIPAPSRRTEDPGLKTLRTLNEAAARWFRGRLEGQGGAAARDYLAGRGIDPGTAERFELGFAPDDRGALLKALRSEGYTDQQIVEAGLAIRPEDGGPPFDRFRHRLMFPIQDERGRVAGFGGRTLGEARAKYLNTPETPLFHKGELLYGHALARHAAHAGAPVVLAEGYLDVIALAQAGFPGAVGPLGTAVTESQLGLLWRMTDVPVVCLDGDRAGLEAAHRLLERALPLLRAGKSLRFALLPAGEDPDSLLRTGGRPAIEQIIEAAVPFEDFLFLRETERVDLKAPERRAALDQRFDQLRRMIPDRDRSWRLLEALRSKLRDRLRTRPAVQGRRPPNPDDGRPGVGASQLAQTLARRERGTGADLLGPILARPELLTLIEEDLARLEFSNPDDEALRQEILSWYCGSTDLEAAVLSNHLAQVGRGPLADVLRSRATGTGSSEDQVSVEVVAERWLAARDRCQSIARDRARAEIAAAIERGEEEELRALMHDADALLNPKLPPTAEVSPAGRTGPAAAVVRTDPAGVPARGDLRSKPARHS